MCVTWRIAQTIDENRKKLSTNRVVWGWVLMREVECLHFEPSQFVKNFSSTSRRNYFKLIYHTVVCHIEPPTTLRCVFAFRFVDLI